MVASVRAQDPQTHVRDAARARWQLDLVRALVASPVCRFARPGAGGQAPALGGRGRRSGGAPTRSGQRQPPPRLDNLREAGMVSARASVLDLDAAPLLQATVARPERLASRRAGVAGPRRDGISGRDAGGYRSNGASLAGDARRPERRRDRHLTPALPGHPLPAFSPPPAPSQVTDAGGRRLVDC